MPYNHCNLYLSFERRALKHIRINYTNLTSSTASTIRKINLIQLHIVLERTLSTISRYTIARYLHVWRGLLNYGKPNRPAYKMLSCCQIYVDTYAHTISQKSYDDTHFYSQEEINLASIEITTYSALVSRVKENKKSMYMSRFLQCILSSNVRREAHSPNPQTYYLPEKKHSSCNSNN